MLVFNLISLSRPKYLIWLLAILAVAFILPYSPTGSHFTVIFRKSSELLKLAHLERVFRLSLKFRHSIVQFVQQFVCGPMPKTLNIS